MGLLRGVACSCVRVCVCGCVRSPAPSYATHRATLPLPCGRRVPQAVVIRENGPPENLVYETDFPTPKPADGQVLVKNEYTGINFIDT